MSFSVCFEDNLSVTHIFIYQIFRAVELAPPFPLPLTELCRGWGSSGSFQPQAVALVMAIRVNRHSNLNTTLFCIVSLPKGLRMRPAHRDPPGPWAEPRMHASDLPPERSSSYNTVSAIVRTVSRDFRPSVFFMNQSYLGH
jgi:hypothetical protein